jgi:hypothetical protein
VVADTIAPLLLMASGLVLWLSVTLLLGGGPLATNGVLLFDVGAVWLVGARAVRMRGALAEGRDG